MFGVTHGNERSGVLLTLCVFAIPSQRGAFVLIQLVTAITLLVVHAGVLAGTVHGDGLVGPTVDWTGGGDRGVRSMARKPALPGRPNPLPQHLTDAIAEALVHSVARFWCGVATVNVQNLPALHADDDQNVCSKLQPVFAVAFSFSSSTVHSRAPAVVHMRVPSVCVYDCSHVSGIELDAQTCGNLRGAWDQRVVHRHVYHTFV